MAGCILTCFPRQQGPLCSANSLWFGEANFCPWLVFLILFELPFITKDQKQQSLIALHGEAWVACFPYGDGRTSYLHPSQVIMLILDPLWEVVGPSSWQSLLCLKERKVTHISCFHKRLFILRLQAASSWHRNSSGIVALPGHCWIFIFIFLKILFIFTQKGREEERERNINVWLPLSHSLLEGLVHNPGMCPRLGIEPVTLWFTGQHSTTEPHQSGPLLDLKKKSLPWSTWPLFLGASLLYCSPSATN